MNKVIVTIASNERDFGIDLELDKEQIMRDCITDIVDTLGNFESRMTFDRSRVRLFSERMGTQINENVTVEEAGIWNGDYVYIMEI